MAINNSTSAYDRVSDLRAFDETKTGVKGLVDSGIKEVPQIFRLSVPENLDPEQPGLTLPTVDLDGIDDPIRRKEVIGQLKDALESWGFFQLVNHGIPISVMEGMIKGVMDFNEQDTEVKKRWYTREMGKSKVVYQSNFDLYTGKVTNWRDTFYCTMDPNPPKPHDFPEPCRDVWPDYASRAKKLAGCLFELISEALGLNPNHLSDMGCGEVHQVIAHYYPSCPQPELALGLSGHTDNNFITLLIQDHVGGLQVFHKNQWIKVTPNPGTLVVNAGDLLQLITNDKFISAYHKVLTNKISARASVASFFTTGLNPKVLEPIKELLSEDNPAKYKGTTVKDYSEYYMRKEPGTSALSNFKI